MSVLVVPSRLCTARAVLGAAEMPAPHGVHAALLPRVQPVR